MEDLLLRFPHISEEIFGNLNDKSLVECRQVCQSWCNSVDDKQCWVRLIRNYTQLCHKDFQKSWRKVLGKAQLQTIRELGSSIRRSYRIIQDLQSLGISEYRIDKTPLHLAVKIGQDDIFRNVSKVSEDKNPADRFGRTPLHYAAKFGRVNLVEIMLKNGIKDLSPRTKMDLIAPIVVNETLDLIRYNRSETLPNEDNFWTPLHYASKYDHRKIYELLLKHIENKNPQDINGRTPLHIAAQSGNIDVSRIIIEESSSYEIEIKDVEQRTPLHLAAEMGHFSICELLIEKSEDKNPIDHWEMTPLHYAARNNHWSICRLIMKNISNISPQNSFGFTPLHFAAAKGCLSICQLINENYGRLDMADNSGITPIHIAAIRGHLSVYQFLLEQLDDKNPKDLNGWNPLDYAERNGHLDLDWF